MPMDSLLITAQTSCGSDVPDRQGAFASAVFLLYLCFLVRMWPWKARILNYIDAALSNLA